MTIPSAPTLGGTARQEPDRAVLFCAADDEGAGDVVADLIGAGGYQPVRMGGLDQSIRIEAFGDPHELGHLGRAATKSEAQKAISGTNRRRHRCARARVDRHLGASSTP